MQLGGNTIQQYKNRKALLTVVSRMARPLRLRSTSSQSCLRETGSRPAVGSSRYTTELPPTMLSPTQSRRFCPPDRVPASACK